MFLLMNCALSWETGRELAACFWGCLGGTQEPLRCSQWMPPTPELVVAGTGYEQPLAPWQGKAMEQCSGHSCVLCVFERCWCSCNLHWVDKQAAYCSCDCPGNVPSAPPFFPDGQLFPLVQCQLSWRGDQRTGWVISNSFCSRCLAAAAHLLAFLLQSFSAPSLQFLWVALWWGALNGNKPC